MKLALAAGALLGLTVGVTSAAFFDHATVAVEPVGATYDLAFAVGSEDVIEQGNPEPNALDLSAMADIEELGAPDTATLQLRVKNNGTTNAGDVHLTAGSLLQNPTPDVDGVTRDPFDVLLMSVAVEGEQATDFLPAGDVDVALADWPAGEIRSVTVKFAFEPGASDGPFYHGRDVLIGLLVTGESR
ncbi:hypothetical protein [Leucobacter chromiiresistens]|uniref:hypothetical protein n=1 Tax=Leucobacter chromiiresistens TaxID=1079994 RepID=UPI000262AF39|nr:hypothetical protein [Leucobacter chromiiresistens]